MAPQLDEWTILDGTAVRCSGCGKFWGITCVAFPEDWVAPPEPTFDFVEGNCWVCVAFDEHLTPDPATLPVGMRGPISERRRA